VALAFQTQAGASLIGVEQQPVVPYVPLFMFAILFGLSTDYNVFLLARVREEWSRHRDHRAAIAAASAGTRRVVTAAGAIMIAVFLGFATDPDPVIKMTGIGLSTAILVDVTLVRLLMAPAAFTLLGDRRWPGRRGVVTPAQAIDGASGSRSSAASMSASENSGSSSFPDRYAS
jgi:RND superfamily putative drug exporter